jgi:hypothetical protein
MFSRNVVMALGAKIFILQATGVVDSSKSSQPSLMFSTYGQEPEGSN